MNARNSREGGGQNFSAKYSVGRGHNFSGNAQTRGELKYLSTTGWGGGHFGAHNF